MEKTWTITITVSNVKEGRAFFETFAEFMEGFWKDFMGGEATVLLEEKDEEQEGAS